MERFSANGTSRPASICPAVIERVAVVIETSFASTAVTAGDLAPPVTAAQRRVLIALCRPFATGTFATPPSNRELAGELCLSVDTVKLHLRVLFEAFGLAALPQHQKRATLARVALERGAVSRHELR